MLLICQSCNAENPSGSDVCRQCGCPSLKPSKFVLLTKEDKEVRVKIGFSWPAALFGFLWAMFKRSWRLSFFLALAFYSLVIFDEVFVQGTQNLLLKLSMLMAYIAVMVIFGKYGNAWLINELKRKGYLVKGEPNA